MLKQGGIFRNVGELPRFLLKLCGFICMSLVKICLLGHPSVWDQSGNRIEISSKKGIALLALLATARHAERSRAWLQQKLWSSRNAAQGKASLRRELSNLRQALGEHGNCIITNHRSIKVDFNKVVVDLFEPDSSNDTMGEFLEGLDIPGEEDFEDWLREMRTQFEKSGSLLYSLLRQRGIA